MHDFNALKSAYEQTAYTPDHALGFVYRKAVYLMLTREVPWKAGVASAERGSCLRFQPTNDDKFSWVWDGKAVKLMSLTEFEELDSYANKGQRFEHLLALRNGQEGKANALPYWKGADLYIEGKPYQVKFEGGSVSEASITSALRELGL